MRHPSLLSWSLPMDRPHNGIPLANGTQGLLVWGSDTLCITVAHDGFWDRRVGKPFLSQTTYEEVKALLQAGDHEGIKAVFKKPSESGLPNRSRQMGGGRLEISLPEKWSVRSAQLDPITATITVTIGNGDGEAEVVIRQCVTRNRSVINIPPELGKTEMILRPSWEWIGSDLAADGCKPPDQWQVGDECGFCQSLPEDDPLAVRAVQESGRVQITTHVGSDALDVTDQLLKEDLQPLLQDTDAWWESYWTSVPSVELPDPILEEMVTYGLYHQACCTPPHGRACTLQGPLMECEKLPPWSNDYHLNINLQMIYTPALATNRTRHFEPLWNMLREWLPSLRESGRGFFQDDEAIMLPHAVDDRCQVVGSFWTGTIDHACAAWIALLCTDYCRYSGDEEVLKELAFPLLKGAWSGYRAMLEEHDGGLHLPVSVSPEYKGNRMDAWGQNSSFQLAAFHAVSRELPRVAGELGEPVDPAWAKTAEQVPPFSSETLPSNDEAPERTHERIVLWKGQDLDGSHRHHSHLAGLTPFRTLDPKGGHSEIISNSLKWWIRRGTGGWSGWCVPWASMIHARSGKPDAAVDKLHSWKRNFTTRGRASLHNADFPGFTCVSSSVDRKDDIMQLDGRFGALSAVLELLVQDWNDEIRVLPSLPRDWKDLSFEGILAPGGFLISAEVVDGYIKEVGILSQRGGPLRIRVGGGPLQEFDTRPGQKLLIYSVP